MKDTSQEPGMGLTVNITDLIYDNGTPPALDDPAENYLFASKLNRSLSHVEVPGVFLLESVPDLVLSTARAGRTLAHRNYIQLPEPEQQASSMSLADLLHQRRSPEAFAAGGGVTLAELSTWCQNVAGLTATVGGVYEGRTYPSGGGLRPCDVFLSIDGVEGHPGGTYFYNARLHRLEHYRDARPEDIGGTTPQPEAFENASVVWLIVAAIWRSRFKYAQRSLRFALMEAGHIGQNICLSLEDSGQATRPIGGFFDDELADLLAFDGIHEFPLYVLVSGQPQASTAPERALADHNPTAAGPEGRGEE